MDYSIKDFLEEFQEKAKEIGGDGSSSINSHDISPKVIIYSPFSGDHYELCEMTYATFPGCGCPSDIVLIIKKREE